MAKSRVLIFSLAYEPFIGGAEVAVKEITNRLPDHDFEMITVNLNGKQKGLETIGNILVNRIEGKYLYPWKALRLAVSLYEQKKYDVVWAIMANQAGMAAARFKKQFPEVKFLLTLQEGDELNSLAYRLRLLGPRIWKVFTRADQIQVISNYLATWARVMGARCPIEVVPNGVDLSKFEALNPKFETNSKSKIIITTSRLVWKNGVDTLIEAMNYLPEDIKLQIIGGGPEEMALRKLMSRCHLDNRVEFLGHVPPEQVARYLMQADVFVRASRSEGLGNSFLEAMAAGVPTVGTPVGGIPDFLHDRETGFLCQVNNPESISKQVKFILDPANTDQVENIKENARKLVEEKYTWPAVAVKMGQLLS